MSQPANKSQLACTFAALALFDDDVEITSENISKLIKAAGVDVEIYWPQLFANAIAEKGGVMKLIQSVTESQSNAQSSAVNDSQKDNTNINKNDNDKIVDDDNNDNKTPSPSPEPPKGIFDLDTDTDSDDSDDSDSGSDE